MGKIFITEEGKIRDVEDVELAEKIVKVRANKDSWAVIDELLKAWAKKAPDDVEAVAINVDQYRNTAVDKVYGQTLGGRDMERRFTLAFPQQLMMMIRTLYSAEELPMDMKFFREFGKRYPDFRVAQKA